MKTSKDRLIQFIESQNITKANFEQKNSLSGGTFSSKSDITTGKLLEISKNYPLLNMDWVVTGRGKMLNDTPEGAQKSEVAESDNLMHDDGAPYGSNITQQTLLSLARGNEKLSQANADLALNALELTGMLKATGNVQQENRQAYDAKLADFLELLSRVASGEKFASHEEAYAAYSKHIYGKKVNRT